MKGIFLAIFISTLALSVPINAKLTKFIPRAPVLPEIYSTPSSNNVDFGTALLSYLKAIQAVMPCGYAGEGIPQMAPFTVEYLPFNFTSEYYRLTGSISDLVITGLNDYRVLKLTYNTTTNRTSYDVNYSQIQLLSEYTMDAWALMAGIPVTVAGNGILNWKFIDYRVLGDFIIAPSASDPNSLEVSDFNMQFFFGDVVPSNWNNMWSIALNNFVNEIVRSETLMVAQLIQPYVDGILKDSVVPMMNDMLQGVNMSMLTAFFENQAMMFNSVSC